MDINKTILKWFERFDRRNMLRILTDKQYISILFGLKFGYKLDLGNPKTFNEKLQWLKIYDRNPIYSTMVDKYEVKKFVADIIGEEYIIPTLGVWDKFDCIDFDTLPEQFVLKCTHDSGGIIICRNKAELDRESAKRKIENSLKRNYYWRGREWPYKNVKPRIIAEKFMKDNNAVDLPVYKFFCFDGEPKIIQVIQNDKQPNESIDYFDTEWNLLDLKQNYPNCVIHMQKPAQLNEMLDTARKLSENKQGFIRVDLYVINEKIYFSEFTFFSDCGFAAFNPEEWDKKLGDLIRLPERK